MRVVLDLEVGDGPVRGSISHDGQPGQPFYGWLEFAARLQRAYCAVVDPVSSGELIPPPVV